MLTYVLLDLAVLVLLLLYVIYRKHMFDFKQMAAVFTVLFVLTTVFDSLIIHFGIVAYDTSKILGIYRKSTNIRFRLPTRRRNSDTLYME